jgi:glutamyl-tRNA reductase
MRVITAGVSHRTAPLEVRERVALADPEIRRLLRFLIGHGSVRGAVVLSTCNRTEIYASAPENADSQEIAARLRRYLDPTGTAADRGYLVVHEDGAAVEHLFRVASGLESMVLGEGQVLAQVRAAHRLALELRCVDAPLDFVLRRATAVGRRVRRETAIAAGVGSLSEAAVAMASEILGGLDGTTVLLVGAGKMSVLAARELHRSGARLRVSSRGGESAALLAGELGATAVTSEDLEAAAVEADLIIASTNSPTPVLSRAAIDRVQERRQRRRLCIIDIAMPRDVEPTVEAIPGVMLLDIDEVGRRLDQDIQSRREAVASAEALVSAAARETVEMAVRRDAADPTIRTLVRQAEGIRRRELARTMARLPGAGEETAERIDQFSRSLVRKLLHGPIAHLRQNHGDPAVALQLRQAFGLDDEQLDER